MDCGKRLSQAAGIMGLVVCLNELLSGVYVSIISLFLLCSWGLEQDLCVYSFPSSLG